MQQPVYQQIPTTVLSKTKIQAHYFQRTKIDRWGDCGFGGLSIIVEAVSYTATVSHSINELFVEASGFEPELREPKSLVLPLHHASIFGKVFIAFQWTAFPRRKFALPFSSVLVNTSRCYMPSYYFFSQATYMAGMFLTLYLSNLILVQIHSMNSFSLYGNKITMQI